MAVDFITRIREAFSMSPSTSREPDAGFFDPQEGGQETPFDHLNGQEWFMAAEQEARAAERRTYDPILYRDQVPARMIEDVQVAAAEIGVALPGQIIRLIPADALAVNAIRGEENTAIFEPLLANRFRDPRDAERAIRTMEASSRFLSGIVDPKAVSLKLDGDNMLHAVILPPTAFPDRIRDEIDDSAALSELGVMNADSLSYTFNRGASFLASSYHELGHIVSAALNLSDRKSAYGVYLDECRSDAFAVFMAVRRDGAREGVSETLRNFRNTSALLHKDVCHWTAPIIDAAHMEAVSMTATNELSRMSPDAIMRRVDGFVRQHAIDEQSFIKFAGDLEAFRSGIQSTTPDTQEGAILQSAKDGYREARSKIIALSDIQAGEHPWLRHLTEEAKAGEDEKAMARDHRLAHFAKPYLRIEIAANRFIAGALTAAGEKDRVRLADLAVKVFSAADNLLGAEQDEFRREANVEAAKDLAEPRQVIKSARETVRDIARGYEPADRRADQIFISTFSRAAEALSRSGSWLGGTRRTLQMLVEAAEKMATLPPGSRDIALIPTAARRPQQVQKMPRDKGNENDRQNQWGGKPNQSGKRPNGKFHRQEGRNGNGNGKSRHSGRDFDRGN